MGVFDILKPHWQARGAYLSWGSVPVSAHTGLGLPRVFPGTSFTCCMFWMMLFNIYRFPWRGGTCAVGCGFPAKPCCTPRISLLLPGVIWEPDLSCWQHKQLGSQIPLLGSSWVMYWGLIFQRLNYFYKIYYSVFFGKLSGAFSTGRAALC